jgi:hypothetical protein
MDALHAAELLYRHNIWRRGDDTYDMANPKELGIALDMAVVALRETATLRARIAELEALNASLKTSAKANKSNYIRQKKKTALYKKQLANTLSNMR